MSVRAGQLHPVDRAGTPYHVRVAPPQTLIDEFRGQPLERRILDLPIPFRDLAADQQPDHPPVGKQLLEGGVVHRWNGS